MLALAFGSGQGGFQLGLGRDGFDPGYLGATLLEAHRVASLGQGDLLQSVAGFFTAATVGYAAIALVLRWTGRGRLWYFGLYCWGAAAFTVIAALSGWLG